MSVASSKHAGSTSRNLVLQAHAVQENTQNSHGSMNVDLGSCWKVIGMTSLTDVSHPICNSSTLSASVSEKHQSYSCTPSFQMLAGSENTDMITSVSMNTSASQNTADISEWRVVGVTPLSPPDAFQPSLCATIGEATLTQSAKYSGFLFHHSDCPESSTADSSKATQEIKSETVQTAANALWPTVTELAAGTSNWKVAGIATLPHSTDNAAYMAHQVSIEKEIPNLSSAQLTELPGSNDSTVANVEPVCSQTASAIRVPFEASNTDLEWTVVGVTTMESGCSRQQAPTFVSPLTPIPVLMASSSLPSLGAGNDESWKVVGMVSLEEPLQQSTVSDLSVCSVTSNGSSGVSNSDFVGSLQQSFKAAPAPRNYTCTENGPTGQVSSSLKSMLDSDNKGNDPNHPLAFLKNCSSHFRNAVLKKNTVSTMLKLKRVVQKSGEDERLIRFLGCKKVFTFHNKDHKRIFSLHGQGKSEREYCESKQENQEVCSPLDKAQRTYHFVGISDINLESEHQCFEDVEDDRVVLADCYTRQLEASRSDSKSKQSSPDRCVVEMSWGIDGPRKDQGHVLFTMSESNTFSAEVGSLQSVSHVSSLTNGGLSLPVVDPWGLCSDKDLGEIAQMISVKEEHKSSCSSSRKRKLSIPRKMIQ